MGAEKYAITKENEADVNREQSYIHRETEAFYSEIMTNALFCLKVENTQAIIVCERKSRVMCEFSHFWLLN